MQIGSEVLKIWYSQPYDLTFLDPPCSYQSPLFREAQLIDYCFLVNSVKILVDFSHCHCYYRKLFVFRLKPTTCY